MTYTRMEFRGYVPDEFGEFEKTEGVSLKNIKLENAKKIMELIDEENISLEEIQELIKNREGVNKEMGDEEKFTEEEKKVTKYLEEHKGENISYRDAVLAALDRIEKPEESQEQKEEFAEYAEKQKKDVEVVDLYISKHPDCSYRNAVKIVLGKVDLSKSEIVVENYISSHEGCSYKEAVLAVLSITGEPKKKE